MFALASLQEPCFALRALLRDNRPAIEFLPVAADLDRELALVASIRVGGVKNPQEFPLPPIASCPAAAFRRLIELVSLTCGEWDSIFGDDS